MVQCWHFHNIYPVQLCVREYLFYVAYCILMYNISWIYSLARTQHIHHILCMLFCHPNTFSFSFIIAKLFLSPCTIYTELCGFNAFKCDFKISTYKILTEPERCNAYNYLAPWISVERLHHSFIWMYLDTHDFKLNFFHL